MYKRLNKDYASLEEKEAMFLTLRLYMEGTKRPRKIVRILRKDGQQVSVGSVREIITEYEAERDRLFLRG